MNTPPQTRSRKLRQLSIPPGFTIEEALHQETLKDQERWEKVFLRRRSLENMQKPESKSREP